MYYQLTGFLSDINIYVSRKRVAFKMKTSVFKG